jgi:hypothetical protein
MTKARRCSRTPKAEGTRSVDFRRLSKCRRVFKVSADSPYPTNGESCEYGSSSSVAAEGSGSRLGPLRAAIGTKRSFPLATAPLTRPRGVAASWRNTGGAGAGQTPSRTRPAQKAAAIRQGHGSKTQPTAAWVRRPDAQYSPCFREAVEANRSLPGVIAPRGRGAGRLTMPGRSLADPSSVGGRPSKARDGRLLAILLPGLTQGGPRGYASLTP